MGKNIDISREEYEQIIVMFLEDVPVAEIEKRIGRSNTPIYRIINEFLRTEGAKIRPLALYRGQMKQLEEKFKKIVKKNLELQDEIDKLKLELFEAKKHRREKFRF